MENVEKLLISRSECAQRLGFSEKKLYELTKAGEIPFLKFGGRVLYSVDSLLGWLRDLEDKQRLERAEALSVGKK